MASVVVAMAACSGNKAPVFQEITSPEDAENRIFTFQSEDGCLVIRKVGYGPENEGMRCYDAEGDLIGMVGKASEARSYNFVKVLFDSDKRVKGFAQSNTSFEDFDGEDAEMDYLMGKIYGNNYEGDEWVRFYLRRDRQGNIVRVFDPENNKAVLTCPKGYRIAPELKESSNFWRDDLAGGSVLMMFNVQPMNPHRYKYEKAKYCGYQLQLKDEFENGKLLKLEVYSPEGKLVNTFDQENEENVEQLEQDLYDNWRGLY